MIKTMNHPNPPVVADKRPTIVNDKNAVKVDLEDDGRVLIYHHDAEIIRKTREMIEDVAREVRDRLMK